MRILSLHLIAFGPFTRTVLEFPSSEKGLHLIYGANEAGKSSALRALRYALYGIPERCADDFVHPYSRMRIGAVIQHSDGRILSFVRRKGRAGTLRDFEDTEPLNDAVIEEFLPGVDEALFSSLFGIDHAVLIQGGEEIISGGGDIGQVLFSAGSGISDFRKIQAGIQTEADRLFKPGGKTPLLNEALARLKHTRKQLRETCLSGSDWESHDQALREADAQKCALEQEMTQWSRSRNRLERIRHALPFIGRREDCLSELSQYQDVPLLPGDFSERHQELAPRLHVTKAEIRRIQAGIEEIDLAGKEIQVAENLLKQGSRIEFFHKKLGEFLKSSLDRPRLKGTLSGILSEAASLLAGIRPDLSLAQVDALKLKKSEISAVQDLCSRYENLIGSRQTLHMEASRYEIKLDKARETLRQIPPIPDTTELYSLVESIRQSGNIEQRYQDLENDIRKSEIRLSADLENLNAMCPFVPESSFPAAPAPETIDRFDLVFRRLSGQSESQEGNRRETEDRLAETRNQMDRLRMEQEPPSETDLTLSRKNRDQLWETMKNQDCWPPYSAMTAEYEHQVHMADELSDRLRREADRVARKAGLLADEQMLRLRLDRIRQESKETETQVRKLRVQWEDLWKPFGFQPLSPPEMQTWNRRYMEWKNRRTDLQEAQLHRERLFQELSDYRVRVSGALTGLGLEQPENSPLSTLLETGHRIIRKAEMDRNRLETLAAEIQHREAELQETRLRIRELEKQLEEWKRHWAEAVRPFGLDADAPPSLALGILDDLKSLWEKLKEAEGYRKRIEGIDRDMNEYIRMVQNFVSFETPDLIDLSLENMVMELNVRLNRAREESARKQSLENQRIRAEKALEEAGIRKTDIEIRLQALLREAGCTCLTELAEIERRSESRRLLESEKERLEQEIFRFSAGARLEEFIADARKVDPDTVDEEIRRLEERMEVHTRQKSELDQIIGRERNELARMDGNRISADLAEECESLLASIQPLARRYARLRLSSHLLAQAVERYREKHQGPLMQRSSELFARMTLGRFIGLRLEYTEKGDGYLAGVRPGGETVTVSGMSDGSADQLYLAVRLAGLEAYLEKREPIPFVIDDILIQFDDARAGTTLEILSELSEKTQILFFTHHRHLITLAERHVNPGGSTIHWIGSETEP